MSGVPTVPSVPTQAVPGLLETSPGVRSCMIEYDQRVLPLAKLLQLLEAVEAELPPVMPSLLPSCSSEPQLRLCRFACSAWCVHGCLSDCYFAQHAQIVELGNTHAWWYDSESAK